jgi:hypothetical protein
MKVNRDNKQKIKNIIHEQLQAIVEPFLCLTKNFESNSERHTIYGDRVELWLDGSSSGPKWVFYILNNKWVELNGTTKLNEGNWSCDGSDNFFITAGNKRYSSKTLLWATINPVFNCILNDAVDRHAEHSFSENEFKVPLKRGDEWVFHKDYKWSNILTKTGELLDSGTWKCDGENEFEIDLPTHTFSSKRGWIKK